MPVHDFRGVDAVYERLLGDRAAAGRRAVVHAARPRLRPDATVFDYRGIISPPRDWERWAALVAALVAHLVERYGLDEVARSWSFEVWNEANLAGVLVGHASGVPGGSTT